MDYKKIIISVILMVLIASQAFSLEVNKVDVRKAEEGYAVRTEQSFTFTVNVDDPEPEDKTQCDDKQEKEDAIVVNTVSEEETNHQRYVKKQLNMHDNYKIDHLVAIDLVVRSNQDNHNFQKIRTVATRLIKQDNKKEVFVKELLNMDRKFVNNIILTRELELKKQVQDYINLVETKTSVKTSVKDSQIEKLFSK